MSCTISIHTSSLLVQVIQIDVKLKIVIPVDVILEIEKRPTTSKKKKFSNSPFTYICRNIDTVRRLYFGTLEGRFTFSLTFQKLSLDFNLEYLSHFFINFNNQ